MADVSISEMRQFVRCRRQWDYASPSRQGLRKIGVPAPALHLGSAVHAALQAQAEGGSWREAVDDYFREAANTYVEQYHERIGVWPTLDEVAQVYEARDQATDVCARYFDRYGTERVLGPGWEVIAVEQTFRVPIPDTDGFLVGTWDRLCRHESGAHAVGDIKTFSVSPDLDKLRIDEQFTAYLWAASAVLGQPVTTLLYDGISKKVPKEPDRLQKGGLSKAWKDTLDYASYRRAVEDNGLDLHDYDDILSKLKERDERPVTPFYARHAVTVGPAQMDVFASYLPLVYREMVNDPVIYPTFNFITGCFDCGVKDLCHAFQHGEDVDWLIRTGYAKTAGSQSFKQRNGPEVEVDAASFA